MNVGMQKVRSIDSKESLKAGAFTLVKEKIRSEISASDLQKPFGEFKTRNSILLTKCCCHHTEIFTMDILKWMSLPRVCFGETLFGAES
jgi:hypothetical protein